MQPAVAPLFCAAALLMPCTGALAEDAAVATVKTARGQASLIDGGAHTPALPGAPVYTRHTLKTGPASSLGLTLRDNTLLSIGPDTELRVDSFEFEPAQDALRLDVSLLRGTLNYVSGVIAKLRPGAVTVRTPTGNIGVRGTHFVVKVEPE